ncbi:SDH family Clp fold serine proteinase [Haematobacter missouriensis]|uniref:SDH family Clp fold serine proteinase n=1 Tax=Haematobacter missouriensis TaxID=366616 RepID=UPI001FD37D61|nr:hypothetical protein [Haematobacter missouriensis]
MTVGLAIEPLDALFAEQGSLDTLRHRACAHEPILGIEDLRSCGTSHADRLLKEDAGLEQVALKIAACVRNELIWVAGGTLIALAADEIVMCEHSVLGPVDPQLGQLPAASLIKVVEEKPIAEIDDQTLIMADVGRKAIAQIEAFAKHLLSDKMDENRAASVAAKLATGTWTHDYPISADEARDMGLPVATDMPKEILELMTLYPQPVRRQGGGVEYLPEPRQREARRAISTR